jgi:Protein of unknown function (DUF1345)
LSAPRRLAIILLLITTAVCASVAAIGFVMGDVKSLDFPPKALHLGLSIAALLRSRMLVHTIFAFRHHTRQLFSFENRQERDVLLLHLAQRGERRGAGRDADDRLAILRDQLARHGEPHELLERARARLR